MHPSDPLTAHFRFSDADGNVYSETKTTTFPAYNTSSYSAQVESYNPNLGTVGEGYSNISLTLTVTNTGEQLLSFSVDTTDSEYETFKNYFTVDVTNALGPNSVTLTVAETGDSTADVMIPDEFLYSPYRSNIRSSRLYKYMIGNELTFYKKKYGLLSNVSNKVLDSYTGLNPSADPIVYPPNNYGYVPVKTGSDTVRDLAFHGRDRL